MQGVGALLIKLSRYMLFLVRCYVHVCIPSLRLLICVVNLLRIFILELRFNVQISPDFRQAEVLKKMVEDKIAKGESLTLSCTMQLERAYWSYCSFVIVENKFCNNFLHSLSLVTIVFHLQFRGKP